MSLTRRSLAEAVLLLALSAAAAPSLADLARAGAAAAILPPTVGVTEQVLADRRSGLGLNGFDPVSYFLAGGPAPGRRDLEAIWGGVAWRFASEANREAFVRDPETYAPRIGGYDAAAAAGGLIAEANPLIFAVHGARLYVFRTPESRARFLADARLAVAAEARWPDLRRELVQP